ncbi:MAG: glycosyltransferase, partial [Rhizobiaceae bacterium]
MRYFHPRDSMKVLQLSSHSTLRPRHGGQMRSHHIGRCLEDAGFDVSRLAICWRTEHDVLDDREPIIDTFLTSYSSSKEFTEKLPFSLNLTDYYSVRAVASIGKYRDQVVDYIDRIKPDFLLLEHPWAWPIARLSDHISSGKAKVIYSSQNVEAHLKRKILGESGASTDAFASELADIETLERDLVKNSWATIVCTPSDADVFSSWGAKKTVVANNGTPERQRTLLKNCLPLTLSPQWNYALFVGSGHPPNIDGFFSLIAPALPFLRPNQRIVIGGGMCDAINHRIATSTSINHYSRDRLVVLGFVDEVVLDAVIENASAILLPIEYGGGSNLKTSEALVSGKAIVGTEASFRGFEQYQDYSQVTLANTPIAFRKAIDDALTKKTRNSHKIPVELFWQSTLSQAVELLKSAN